MGWSYELCTPADRLLWARASVFEGRFDLDAAEDICVVTAELLDLLSALVDKSILTRTEAQRRGSVPIARDASGLRQGADPRAPTDYPELRRRHPWTGAGGWCTTLRQIGSVRVRCNGCSASIGSALNVWGGTRIQPCPTHPQTALEMIGTIHPFGIARGRLTHDPPAGWIARWPLRLPRTPPSIRIRALFGGSDHRRAAGRRARPRRSWVEQGRAPGRSRWRTPRRTAMIDTADGLTALGQR